VRGLDQFDTPPVALEPLFVHEPLLAGVKSIGEHFCGKGNLVLPMRARGIQVYASDIVDRGCPDSKVVDFLKMTKRPPDCDVLLTNPAYDRAMDYLEHAWRLGYRVVIFLHEPRFLHTADRYERLHKPGHLVRYYPIAERLQDMHDAAYLAAGGEKSSQSRLHAWYVFDRDYCGPAATIPMSINDPTAHMPWQPSALRAMSAGVPPAANDLAVLLRAVPPARPSGASYRDISVTGRWPCQTSLI
jgi:hypothetical protein